MRDTCDQLFIENYMQLRTLFVSLCLKSNDRYSFNILRIITLFYHLYIEYEIYNLAYNTRKIILYVSLFIDGAMGKSGGVVTFLGFLRAVGH